MRLNSKTWTLVLLSLLLLFAAGCGNGGDDAQGQENGADNGGQAEGPPALDFKMDDDEVIAEYEGGTVDVADFETFLNIQAMMAPMMHGEIANPDNWELFLKRYIAEKILAAQADNQEEAEKQADDILKQITEAQSDQVKKDMENYELTEEDLKQYFVRYTMLQDYLQSLVTDEELEAKYDELSETGEFTIASVRHILIKWGEETRTEEEAKQLAADLVERLRGGEDFAALAKEHSEDPGSKENGGLYENQPVNGWVEPFKLTAMEQEIGKISDPVRVEAANYSGYHIIKVEARDEKPLEEVKGDVESYVLNEKYNQFFEEELDGKITKLQVPKALN